MQYLCVQAAFRAEQVAPKRSTRAWGTHDHDCGALMGRNPLNQLPFGSYVQRAYTSVGVHHCTRDEH